MTPQAMDTAISDLLHRMLGMPYDLSDRAFRRGFRLVMTMQAVTWGVLLWTIG